MPKNRKVTVLAIASFEGVRKGDMAEVTLTPRLEGIIKAGYLRVVEDVGTVETGPSGDSVGESGGSSEGAVSGGPAGSESSEDLDAG